MGIPLYSLFPSTRTHVEPATGRRRHLHETVVQRGVRDAVLAAEPSKRASCHTLRYSFATHLLKGAYDIRTIQELLGRQDVSTRLISTHVLNRRGGWGAESARWSASEEVGRGGAGDRGIGDEEM